MMEPVSSVFWFGDSEIPISKQAPEWGRSKATPVGTLLGRRRALGIRSEVPTCPRPHSSSCQDATDCTDAEDFPCLWFFCLF